MSKRKKQEPHIPTEEEILSMRNVSVKDASLYLGWSESNVRAALREGRAPFGVAFHNPGSTALIFKISPGALIKYQHEGCTILPFSQMRKGIEHSVRTTMLELIAEGSLAITIREEDEDV